MNFDALREAIASDNPGRARPALASLVEATPEQAEPLLLLGLQQSDMLLRQLSCSGLGHKPTPPAGSPWFTPFATTLRWLCGRKPPTPW